MASRSEVFAFVADHKRIAQGSARRTQVRLSVQDALEAGRANWPVNGGVPIPTGALASCENCRLLDAAGKVVPAAFRELSWWPDGSVKWVLVSLVHQGGAGEYVLEYGEDVAQPEVAGEQGRGN